jgi:ATP-binding cassette subfamily B (MDR/TAP) protein 7
VRVRWAGARSSRMLASRICLKAAARPSLTASLSIRPVAATVWRTRRVFATTPQHRKEDVARIQTTEKDKHARQPAEESVKPETVKKDEPAQPDTARTDPLLAEQTVTNKEQRKADWAIIKDMSHYLWPKNDFGTKFRVGLSVGLLIGAKVCKLFSHSSETRVLIDYVGPQRSSPILLQVNRR